MKNYDSQSTFHCHRKLLCITTVCMRNFGWAVLWSLQQSSGSQLSSEEQLGLFFMCAHKARLLVCEYQKGFWTQFGKTGPTTWDKGRSSECHATIMMFVPTKKYRVVPYAQCTRKRIHLNVTSKQLSLKLCIKLQLTWLCLVRLGGALMVHSPPELSQLSQQPWLANQCTLSLFTGLYRPSLSRWGVLWYENISCIYCVLARHCTSRNFSHQQQANTLLSSRPRRIIQHTAPANIETLGTGKLQSA